MGTRGKAAFPNAHPQPHLGRRARSHPGSLFHLKRSKTTASKLRRRLHWVMDLRRGSAIWFHCWDYIIGRGTRVSVLSFTMFNGALPLLRLLPDPALLQLISNAIKAWQKDLIWGLLRVQRTGRLCFAGRSPADIRAFLESSPLGRVPRRLNTFRLLNLH